MKVGDNAIVKVNYPKNPNLNGVYQGTVVKIGCFRTGFAYFLLDTFDKPLPNSKKYTEIEVINKQKSRGCYNGSYSLFA